MNCTVLLLAEPTPVDVQLISLITTIVVFLLFFFAAISLVGVQGSPTCGPLLGDFSHSSCRTCKIVPMAEIAAARRGLETKAAAAKRQIAALKKELEELQK